MNSKPKYKCSGIFSNFREISEILNLLLNSYRYFPRPRYRYRGIFSNFKEISEILNKQYNHNTN